MFFLVNVILVDRNKLHYYYYLRFNVTSRILYLVLLQIQIMNFFACYVYYFSDNKLLNVKNSGTGNDLLNQTMKIDEEDGIGTDSNLIDTLPIPIMMVVTEVHLDDSFSSSAVTGARFNWNIVLPICFYFC